MFLPPPHSFTLYTLSGPLAPEWAYNPRFCTPQATRLSESYTIARHGLAGCIVLPACGLLSWDGRDVLLTLLSFFPIFPFPLTPLPFSSPPLVRTLVLSLEVLFFFNHGNSPILLFLPPRKTDPLDLSRHLPESYLSEKPALETRSHIYRKSPVVTSVSEDNLGQLKTQRHEFITERGRPWVWGTLKEPIEAPAALTGSLGYARSFVARVRSCWTKDH